MNSRVGKNTTNFFKMALPSLDLITKFEYSHIAVSRSVLEMLSNLHEVAKVVISTLKLYQSCIYFQIF